MNRWNAARSGALGVVGLVFASACGTYDLSGAGAEGVDAGADRIERVLDVADEGQGDDPRRAPGASTSSRARGETSAAWEIPWPGADLTAPEAAAECPVPMDVFMSSVRCGDGTWVRRYKRYWYVTRTLAGVCRPVPLIGTVFTVYKPRRC